MGIHTHSRESSKDNAGPRPRCEEQQQRHFNLALQCLAILPCSAIFTKDHSSFLSVGNRRGKVQAASSFTIRESGASFTAIATARKLRKSRESSRKTWPRYWQRRSTFLQCTDCKCTTPPDPKAYQLILQLEMYSIFSLPRL